MHVDHNGLDRFQRMQEEDVSWEYAWDICHEAARMHGWPRLSSAAGGRACSMMHVRTGALSSVHEYNVQIRTWSGSTPYHPHRDMVCGGFLKEFGPPEGP